MTAAKRGRGRPAIGDPIAVRFTPEQLDYIDALAERNDLPRAETIRRMIDVAISVAESARG